jgi:hypothetical protein
MNEKSKKWQHMNVEGDFHANKFIESKRVHVEVRYLSNNSTSKPSLTSQFVTDLNFSACHSYLTMCACALFCEIRASSLTGLQVTEIRETTYERFHFITMYSYVNIGLFSSRF